MTVSARTLSYSKIIARDRDLTIDRALNLREDITSLGSVRNGLRDLGGYPLNGATSKTSGFIVGIGTTGPGVTVVE